ncbi:AraC family transcriptional regulator [Shewanella sp. GXUN23E]|uniref:AraC family transcriptional regulator n=1 Tax=Shewanella sp. GXUN23E TaxID=3422498 RepID=UPI003D7D2D33
MDKQADLLARIELAVDLMAAEPDWAAPTPLAELAQAASLSGFHFQRIYRLLMGETCEQTRHRIKLTRMANQLASCQRPFSSVSSDAGYTSSLALARVLGASHGSAQQVGVPSICAAIADIIEPSGQGAPLVIGPKVALMRTRKLQGISLPQACRYQELELTFQRLTGLLDIDTRPGARLAWPADDSCQDPASHTFECMLALEPGFLLQQQGGGQHELAPQTCLSYQHLGSYAELGKATDWLYAVCLNELGDVFADAPCLYHFVTDTVTPDNHQTGLLRTDIYLPVDIADKC